MPIYINLVPDVGVEVCSNNIDGEWNKLGNRKLMRVSLPDVSPRTIRVTGQNIEETRVNVYFQGTLAHRLNSFTQTSVSEEFTPAQAGVYIIEYYTSGNTDEQNPGIVNRDCIEISIN